MDRLGDLERATMVCLWDAGEPLTARQVHASLRNARDLAYTTVSTTLMRLARKGLVEQQRVKRSYTYQAIAGRDEMFDSMLNDALGFANRDPAVFTRFVHTLSEEERAALRTALENVSLNESS